MTMKMTKSNPKLASKQLQLGTTKRKPTMYDLRNMIAVVDQSTFEKEATLIVTLPKDKADYGLDPDLILKAVNTLIALVSLYIKWLEFSRESDDKQTEDADNDWSVDNPKVQAAIDQCHPDAPEAERKAFCERSKAVVDQDIITATVDKMRSDS